MVEGTIISNHHIVAIAERSTEMNIIIIIIIHTREEDRGNHMITMIAHHIHDHTTKMVIQSPIMTGTKRGEEENRRHDNIEKVDNTFQSIVIITMIEAAAGGDMSMAMNLYHRMCHHTR